VSATATGTAATWLASWAAVIESGDLADSRQLFRPDASWRDIVSLTADIRSVAGEAGITGMLRRCRDQIRPGSIRLNPHWPALPQQRADRDLIEALFEFETNAGQGNGVVRLSLEDGAPRAWTILTALRELTACPGAAGRPPPLQR